MRLRNIKDNKYLGYIDEIILALFKYVHCKIVENKNVEIKIEKAICFNYVLEAKFITEILTKSRKNEPETREYKVICPSVK